MIATPSKQQTVQIWYREGVRDWMPYHGRVGRVVIVGRGKPRNHGVEVGCTVVSVPCGNLRRPPDQVSRGMEV